MFDECADGVGAIELLDGLFAHLVVDLLRRPAAEAGVVLLADSHARHQLFPPLLHVIDLMLNEKGGDLNVGVHGKLFDGGFAVLLLVLSLGSGLNVRADLLYEVIQRLVVIAYAHGEIVVRFGQKALLDVGYRDRELGLLAGNLVVGIVVGHDEGEFRRVIDLQPLQLGGKARERERGGGVYNVLRVRLGDDPHAIDRSGDVHGDKVVVGDGAFDRFP